MRVPGYEISRLTPPGSRVIRGILLHPGSTTVAFGQNLYAVPVSALWRVEGKE
jgi:hypothetical protein